MLLGNFARKAYDRYIRNKAQSGDVLAIRKLETQEVFKSLKGQVPDELRVVVLKQRGLNTTSTTNLLRDGFAPRLVDPLVTKKKTRLDRAKKLKASKIKPTEILEDLWGDVKSQSIPPPPDNKRAAQIFNEEYQKGAKKFVDNISSIKEEVVKPKSSKGKLAVLGLAGLATVAAGGLIAVKSSQRKTKKGKVVSIKGYSRKQKRGKGFFTSDKPLFKNQLPMPGQNGRYMNAPTVIAGISTGGLLGAAVGNKIGNGIVKSKVIGAAIGAGTVTGLHTMQKFSPLYQGNRDTKITKPRKQKELYY